MAPRKVEHDNKFNNLDSFAILKTRSILHSRRNEKLTLLTIEPSANSTMKTIDSNMKGQTEIYILALVPVCQ